MSEKDMTLVLNWYRRNEELLRFRGSILFEPRGTKEDGFVEVFVQYGVAHNSANKGLIARISYDRYEELRLLKTVNKSHFLPDELVKKDGNE